MKKLKPDLEEDVDEIVKSDYRTAEVFKKYGINYCCTGKMRLDAVCVEKNIDPGLIMKDLKQAMQDYAIPNSIAFNDWKIDFLIDFITHIHHQYIYETVPVLANGLRSFAAGHSKKYPELAELSDVMTRLSEILLLHNRHEDEIIFPYIKQIESAHRRKETYGNLFVRTLRKPLSIVEKEHEQIVEYLDRMQVMTNDFLAPEKACTHYQVLYRKLKEFHDNLLQHKFLENNILFPKAMGIEQQLLQK